METSDPIDTAIRRAIAALINEQFVEVGYQLGRINELYRQMKLDGLTEDQIFDEGVKL